MTLTRAFPKSDRHAQLVWLDPGATTGICCLAVRPSWLEGQGEPSAEGLRKAVSSSWFGQVGRVGRVEVGGRAKPADRAVALTPGQRNAVPAAAPVTLRDELDAVKQCEAVLDLWPDAAWGYEDFVPTMLNQTRDFLAPVRVFAALTYTEVVYGERGRLPFVQSASLAKTTATDPRLSAAGLYRPGLPHATDAARHAMTFLRRARVDAELRFAAWPKLFHEPALNDRQLG